MSQPLDIIRRKYNIGSTYMPERSDEIHGIEKIKVELIDYPKNPYRAIFEVVTSTWGSRTSWWNRWENTPVEGRIFVVVSALSRNTLPQALESISFTWKIQGLSRSAYDQLARHRHTGIGSVGMRDNNWLDAALVLPQDLIDDKELYEEIKKWWKYTKDLYEKIVKKGQHSWQSARFILPMGTEWRFTWTMNYRAFQELAGARLKFCEQFDSVIGSTKVPVFTARGVLKILEIEKLFKQYRYKAIIDSTGREIIKLKKHYLSTIAIKDDGTVIIAPIRAIIRHKVKKGLWRVKTKFGEVIVTEDHSLIGYNVERDEIILVRPKDLNENVDKILLLGFGLYDSAEIVSEKENNLSDLQQGSERVFSLLQLWDSFEKGVNGKVRRYQNSFVKRNKKQKSKTFRRDSKENLRISEKTMAESGVSMKTNGSFQKVSREEIEKNEGALAKSRISQESFTKNTRRFQAEVVRSRVPEESLDKSSQKTKRESKVWRIIENNSRTNKRSSREETRKMDTMENENIRIFTRILSNYRGTETSSTVWRDRSKVYSSNTIEISLREYKTRKNTQIFIRDEANTIQEEYSDRWNGNRFSDWRSSDICRWMLLAYVPDLLQKETKRDSLEDSKERERKGEKIESNGIQNLQDMGALYLSKTLRNLKRNNVFIGRVEEIEFLGIIEDYVYDLEVDEAHTFLANNIFVHNTVATVWLMWKTLWDKFPLLAAFVRPGCDWSNSCQYYRMYSLSSLFGSLFKPCGRHSIVEDKKYKNMLKEIFPDVYKKWVEQVEKQRIYSSWNMTAADAKEIEEKLNIKIPEPNDWNKLVQEAIRRDRKFFE